MDYRVLTEAERKYTFSQSQQLSMQTGLIGYLRADFGTNGKEFWTTWNDFRKSLKTDKFKAEFDDMINELRNGDVLADRKAMSSYCYSTPDSSFNDERNHYGIRLDTDKFSYLMRLNPNKGEYNLYCYCYQKEWLILSVCCQSQWKTQRFTALNLIPFRQGLLSSFIRNHQ